MSEKFKSPKLIKKHIYLNCMSMNLLIIDDY